MDRRTTLAKMLGRKTAASALAAPPPGLSPYAGQFGYEQAAHLLRRTMFGATKAQIEAAAAAGLDATLGQLLAAQPLPDPPLNFNDTEDPNVAVGETWVGVHYEPGLVQAIRGKRNQSFNAWTAKLWKEEGVSLREKMVIFWHNHYVVGNINDPAFVYKYISLLRENCFGNFRELTKAITIDPAMLRYLNGNQNRNGSPNENYARELLELFTIGKGPQVGPGDYTNYTEDDVVQMARVLTGWQDRGFSTINPDVLPQSIFIPNRHDTGEKQLSGRFDNLVISDMGDQEYAHLIDVIFSKEECARFLCRKLYRWFVYYVIDDAVEADVIEPMAQLLLDNDYEIAPVLDALLRSEHFFDVLSVGPMIRYPIDFVMSTMKTCGVEFPAPNLEVEYLVYLRLVRGTFNNMQMVMYNPPNVAGWKAWYQEPTFYRQWINSTTLGVRKLFTDTLVSTGYGVGQQRARVDSLAFVATLDNPFDPNVMIDELAKILYPQPIVEAQRDVLKSILIPGLPDFEWTVEYGEYLDNPDNPDLIASTRNKLDNLLMAMFTMPEFYLS